MLVGLILAGITVGTVAVADDNIGCGVGTMIWKGNSGIIFQLLGTCTNGIMGNQTFGITTGTLGCKSGGVITMNQRVNMFASANIDKLAADMASGQGETLDALGTLYGMTAADKVVFSQLMKDNFAVIFSSQNLTAGDMVQSMQSLMASDAQLSGYVAQI